MQHLEGLNKEQREAVETTKGPLLVLAGAGSGKTRVITHRIVHIIQQGIAPHNILAVTFTNKAAKEMRERVHALIKQFPGSRAAAHDSLPTVTTFHSFGVRTLREFHHTLNLPKHFTIYDRADSIRAIKSALEEAGYSVKQFEPRRILSMISKAKGDAVSLNEYSDDASSYPEKVAAEVWARYETLLQKEKALDFDDLLGKTYRLLRDYAEVRSTLQRRYQYLHIDEYQDTNKVQFHIARLLAEQHQNICVVGDLDQCLAGDTKVTLADNSKKNIRDIKKGELVLSNYGSGDYRPARVLKVHKNKKPATVTITTRSRRTLVSTPQHKHFAGYHRDHSPQLFLTYLMYKKGVGYRLGVSSIHGQGEQLGFVQRTNHEHADAIWIINTHQSSTSARTEEYILSLRYSIPTLPFVARKSKNTGGYVHDQEILNTVFESFDTEASAQKLLNSFSLEKHHPHHRPQASRSHRQNILISLCGDRRGAQPMHRISIACSDDKVKSALTEAGFSIRPAKKTGLSWRFETCRASYKEIQDIAKKIHALLPETIIIEQGRLGTTTTETQRVSLPVIKASAVKPGMVLFVADGSYDVVENVVEHESEGSSYDLTIEHTHNFIANDIVTHNSIYSWRGADIKNVLQFERQFPGAKTILLEENYRSTKTIIAASNDVIAKNKNRIEKNVFTNNADGENITLYAARDGASEAEYIALSARDLIEKGVAPSEIAVLYRTNFQSRGLEEAFLNMDIPYQLLGTKFFERKEVKDVLSFLRLALNPDSTADLARIINVPVRGIGKVTALKVIEGNAAALTGATAEKVSRFFDIMRDIKDTSGTETISETLKFIVARTGLEMHYRKSGTEEDLERLENLRELVSFATRFDELPPDEAIEALIENAALQSDQDELAEGEARDAVRLMTVHASKGLEFPYVFITGLEEGLFPHERLDDSGVDHEEERRLFYVALTRAGKKVFLTYTHLRTIFGQQRVNVPSSFLNDIDREYVDTHGDFRDWGDGGDDGSVRTVFLD